MAVENAVKSMAVENKVSSIAVENAVSSSLNIAQEADADEGLIFYDPQAEMLAKKEIDFQEKQRNKMNLN